MRMFKLVAAAVLACSSTVGMAEPIVIPAFVPKDASKVDMSAAEGDGLGLYVRLSCGHMRGTGARLNDTVVMTAYHVVKQGSCIAGNGAGQKAVILYSNPRLDIAYVEVVSTNQPHWEISCREPQLQEVYSAYGYAQGKELRGANVIGTGLTLNPYGGASFAMFRGTEGVDHGMSGGPLVDADGRLVGIISGKGQNDLAGMSFARMLIDSSLCNKKRSS